MKKMNNKGFMLIEILAVTLVVIVIFLAIYVNYYPLVGEYEKRIEYNDISTKYSLFYLKKLYSNPNNIGRNNIRKDIIDNNVLYVDLLEYDDINNKIICNRRYINNNLEDQNYCDSLVEKMGVKGLVATQFNIQDLKAVSIEEELDQYVNYLLKGFDNYIDYLPRYSSFTNDNTMYRMLVKTDTGYATTKLDIDILSIKFTYYDTDNLVTTFKPGETKNIYFDMENEKSKSFFYRFYDLDNDLFTVKYFLQQDASLTSGEVERGSLSIKYTGTAVSNEVDIRDLFGISLSLTNNNFAMEEGYTAITNGTTLAYDAIANYQRFIAPEDGYYKVKTYGAGQDANFKGGYNEGTIHLTAGEKLYVYVGSRANGINGGWNGGGNSGTFNTSGLGGSGATDVRYFVEIPDANNLAWNSDSGLNARIMVAAGSPGGSAHAGAFGQGGGLNGTGSYETAYEAYKSYGGTQLIGGAGATPYTETTASTAGTFGIGGTGGQSSRTGYGGGGGGGYYGGGGGSGAGTGAWAGGGGSSYISGYLGAIAITGIDNRTAKCNETTASTTVSCSYHYSDKKFDNSYMLSGTNNGNGTASIKYLSNTTNILTADLDGGTGKTSYTVAYKDTIMLEEPKKTAYSFQGWTLVSGAGSSVSDNTFTMGSAPATIKATWKAATYTVVYNCNSATARVITGAVTESTHTFGVTGNLNSNPCYNVVAGAGTSGKVYSFLGWALTETGDVRYGDKESVTDLTTEGSITLYAKWSSMFKYSNSSYTVLDDGAGDWRIKFTSGGTLTMYYTTLIDAFLVGGGGSGCRGVSGTGGGGGGSGGKTFTQKARSLTATTYSIVVGVGGTATASVNYNTSYPATASTAFGYSAAGGNYGGWHGNAQAGITWGADGGSSGGGTGWGTSTSQAQRAGGSYGLSGAGGRPGTGWGKTTCEFDEGTTSGCTKGTSYAYGGGGGGGGYCSRGDAGQDFCRGGAGGIGGGGRGGHARYYINKDGNLDEAIGKNGTANTGGGGGGGSAYSGARYAGGNGGTGIVIIRKAQ